MEPNGGGARGGEGRNRHGSGARGYLYPDPTAQPLFLKGTGHAAAIGGAKAVEMLGSTVPGGVSLSGGGPTVVAGHRIREYLLPPDISLTRQSILL